MLFRLALAMGRTIQELRAVLSYAEFQEWCLYYQIEPWGEDRADLRAGIVASTLHNVYAASGWVRTPPPGRPTTCPISTGQSRKRPPMTGHSPTTNSPPGPMQRSLVFPRSKRCSP
jgi:hypothetical protein